MINGNTNNMSSVVSLTKRHFWRQNHSKTVIESLLSRYLNWEWEIEVHGEEDDILITGGKNNNDKPHDSAEIIINGRWFFFLTQREIIQLNLQGSRRSCKTSLAQPTTTARQTPRRRTEVVLSFFFSSDIIGFSTEYSYSEGGMRMIIWIIEATSTVLQIGERLEFSSLSLGGT